MPYWLYRNSSLIWENYTGDSNAASCSPVQTNASQLRDNCVTFQSLVTACIVGGRPAGELWLCVCVYTCVWMGWRLRGSGMSGWVGTGSCVWDCVCVRQWKPSHSVLKASIHGGPESSGSLQCKKNSKLFYLKLCLTIAWNNRRYLFMKQGKSWGRFIYLTHAEKSWIEAEPSHFGSESKDNMKKAVWQLTWLNH